MADWSLPDINELYTDIIDELNARDVDAITLCLVDPTNKPTGAIRWNRGTSKFQEWSGAAWVDMTVTTGLGLGTMATQNSNAVNITGGTIGTAVNIDASRLTSGTVPDARFPATLPVASGANLTALNGSAITSGIVANARTTAVSTNTASAIVTRDANGDFAMRDLAGRSPTFSGTVHANLIAGDGATSVELATNGVSRFQIYPGGSFRMGPGADLGGGQLYHVSTGEGTHTLEYGGVSDPATIVAYYRSDSLGGGTSGSVTVSGNTASYNTASDRRIKKDIKKTKLAGLKTLLKLKVKDFKMRFGSKKEQAHIRTGLIAQEVESIYPAAVTKPTKMHPHYQLDYSKFVPLLIKSVQELSEKVEKLEAQLGKS